MIYLQDIDITPDRHTPTISVYPNRCVISGSGCQLLQLSDSSPRVRVKSDLDNRGRLYISRSNNDSGYYTTGRKHGITRRINSAAFSRKLAELLEGYGTYKICEDSSVIDGSGVTNYELFFRKCRTIRSYTRDNQTDK